MIRTCKKIDYKILGFPFPPSVNEAYTNVPGKGRVRTGKYTLFLKECRNYSLNNRVLLNWVSEALEGKFYIKLYIDLVVSKDRIICKSKKLKGKPKIFDSSNRIKALEDALFKLLDKDDSIVFEHQITKYPGENDYVDIGIKIIKLPELKK